MVHDVEQNDEDADDRSDCLHVRQKYLQLHLSK